MLTMKKINSLFAKIFLMTVVAAMASGVINRADAAVTMTLSANTQAASNYCQGTTGNIIHSFIIASSGTGTPNLTQIIESIGGTWVGGGTDVLNFKLYYTTTSTFATTNLLATITNPATGTQTFTFTSPALVSPASYWFWITADFSATAGNHTLIPAAMTTASFTSTSTKAGSAGAGNTKTIVVKSTNPTSATASPASVCSGSPSTLTLVGGGGGTGTVVKWYTGSCGGTLVGTGNPLVVNPASATTYYGRYEDPAPCSNNTTCATVTVNMAATVTPTVTVTTNPVDAGGVINVCSGQNVTFTITGYTNQGTGQTYQWYNSGGPIAGATATSYASSSLANGEIIYCIMTCTPNSPSYCPSPTTATSTTFSINYKTAPSQPGAITGLSTVCSGQNNVTYTTTGSSPAADSYTWTVPGGTIVSGQGTTTITVNWGTVVSNTTYTINVIGVNCGTLNGTARTKTVTVNALAAPPALTIADAAAGPTTICQYLVVNFSATITESSLSKVAVWKVDGNTIFTSAANTNPAYFTYPNSGSFSYPFANPGAHTVTCEITFAGQPAPSQCFSPNVTISNTLNYTVTQNEHPSVSIISTQDTNHFCRGTLDVFTATAVDAGTGPFTWYVDGLPDLSSSTSTFNYIPLTAGVHIVYCVVRSDQHCDSMPPNSNPPVFYDLEAYSNTQIVNVDPCTYYVPASGNLGPYNACGGIFYDSQTDPGANYTNSQSGTTTFCSAIPGQFVSVTFTSMALADNGDILRLYSGIGTGGPLLQTFQGPISTSSFCGAVISQDVSGGCITAQFQTNASGVAAGWVGNIACSPTSAVTPAGVNCANPTVISSLPYTATGHTTQCFINDYSNQAGICNSTYNGEDRVYQYTAAGPECTNIMMSGTSGNPALAVYQGCPGAGGVCLTPAPLVGNNSMQFTFPAAGTYFIIVDEATGFSNYTLTIQSFGLAPSNDLPCNAQYIDLLVSVNGNTSCTGSANEPATVPSCWTTGTINATWHYFVAPPSGSVRIRTNSGTIGSTQIALYSLTGSCSNPANFNLLACNRIGPTCNAPNPLITSSEIAITGLTPANNYYVRVDGINNNTGNYSIMVADQSGPQPYVAGQDCVVPLPVCSHQFSIPTPGFYNTGWVCDFTSANNSCLTSGELNSCWLVFSTIGTGNLAFKVTPYGVNPPSTDYDWVLMDITSYGSDQATRITSACTSINANVLPWVRCNLTGAAASFPTCCTANYCTGLCPSATNTSSPPSASSYCSAVSVVAGQTFLLFLMNHWQNNVGFNIDFDAFGVSPIGTSLPPATVFWTGTVSTDWFNAGNWGNCGPPDCSSNAIIYNGALNYPVIPTGPIAQCRGLDIRAGASVSLTGFGQLDICGNFVNNGSLTASQTSIVNLVNSSSQYFDGFMTGSSAFGSVMMSKSPAAASKLTLLDNMEMTGTLTLANTAFGGKILTGLKELYITNNSPSSCNFGSPTSYVEGNLRRNLNGTLSNGTYYFPVGHATPGYQLATIDFTSTHSIPNLLGYFTPWGSLPAALNVTDAPCSVNYNTTPGFYDNGYWTLTASANASSANYNLRLRNAGVSNGPGTFWTVAKAATVAGPWSLNGTCFNDVYPFAKRTAMSGFSVFATAQSGNALPVSLLTFDAVVQGSEVETSWATASETNNDYFIIERSVDGVNYEKVGTRKSVGNSTTELHYSLIDPKPFKGVSYYRLRQIDLDGLESSFGPVAVNLTDNTVLNVFPNPANTEVQYRFISAAEGIVSVEISDALGRMVYSDQMNVKKGENTSDPVRIGSLPVGVYILQVKPVNSDIIEPMQKRFIKKLREE